jgi:hypothetical protein
MPAAERHHAGMAHDLAHAGNPAASLLVECQPDAIGARCDPRPARGRQSALSAHTMSARWTQPAPAACDEEWTTQNHCALRTVKFLKAAAPCAPMRAARGLPLRLRGRTGVPHQRDVGTAAGSGQLAGMAHRSARETILAPPTRGCQGMASPPHRRGAEGRRLAGSFVRSRDDGAVRREAGRASRAKPIAKRRSGRCARHDRKAPPSGRGSRQTRIPTTNSLQTQWDIGAQLFWGPTG